MQTIKMVDAGSQKIALIKLVKEFTNLGLKESKELVDTIPSIIETENEVGLIQKFIQDCRMIGAVVEWNQNSAISFEATPTSTIKLRLVDAGKYKIEAIKLVRMFTGLGLKESKDLVDNVPSVLSIPNNEVSIEQLIKNFQAIGAIVEDLVDDENPPAVAAGGDISAPVEQQSGNFVIRDFDKTKTFSTSLSVKQPAFSGKLVLKQSIIVALVAAVAKSVISIYFGYNTFYLVFVIAPLIGYVMKKNNPVFDKRTPLFAFGLTILYYFATHFSDWFIFNFIYHMYWEISFFRIILNLFISRSILVLVAAFVAFLLAGGTEFFNKGSSKNSDIENVGNKQLEKHKKKERF